MPVRAPKCAVLSMVLWASVMIARIALRAQQSPFPLSSHCYGCHNNLKTAKGQDVSIASPWRASIMANSARDPTGRPACAARPWITHPPHRPLRTSAPHATCPCSTSSTNLPATTPPFYLACRSTPLTMPIAAAADGVSCTVCHQAEPAALGTSDSYNGNLTIAPVSQHPRPLYGPYAADARSISIHNLASGLTVTQSDHLQQAGLCGSCHTLYTPTLDASGKPAGRFPEQMPYLEWHPQRLPRQADLPVLPHARLAGSAPVATLGSRRAKASVAILSPALTSSCRIFSSRIATNSPSPRLPPNSPPHQPRHAPSSSPRPRISPLVRSLSPTANSSFHRHRPEPDRP